MTNEPPDLLDPISFARFLLLPGAGRLLAAFGDIPPGPLRESVIHHAEVIASTYTGAPPKHRMPDPIKELARTANVSLPPQRLDTITGRPPPPLNEPITADGNDRDSKIIAMRLKGHTPSVIAKRMKLTQGIVWSVLAKARKAGIDIPKRAAPGAAMTGHNWHSSTATMSAQALKASQKAADRRGITVDEYLERRRIAVEMAQQGHGYDTIIKAINEPDEKVVSAWLSNARMSGISIPYVGGVTPALEPLAEPPADAIEAAAAAPQEPQDAPEPDIRRDPTLRAVDPTSEPIFGLLAEMHQGALRAMESAAQRRGQTLQEYVERREKIARMGLAGFNVTQIVKELGEDRTFVRDTFISAERRGVKFPTEQVAA